MAVAGSEIAPGIMQGLVPVPDPTALTTQLVDRAIAAMTIDTASIA